MSPLPLICMAPRSSNSNMGAPFLKSRSLSAVDCEIWISPGGADVSMRAAVFTQSPNSLYLGNLTPMMPPITWEWRAIRRTTVSQLNPEGTRDNDKS